MDISKYRKKIDKIDSKLLQLLNKRMEIMPYVAAYKQLHHLPLTDPAREKEILKNKRELADKYGLSKDFVEKLFKMLFEESKIVQKNQNKNNKKSMAK